MNPKIYLFHTLESLTTPFVKLADWQELKEHYKKIQGELTWHKDYCDRLVAQSNMPCLPKDLENLRDANTSFAMENERLRNQLYKAGICPDCEEEVSHFVDEPFASCPCGTGEDCSGPSTIQKLRMDNVELLKLAEELNAENKDLINHLEESTTHADSLADQIREKNGEIKGWRNKWECAVEMAAIAENKLADAEKNVRYWQNSFNGMSDKAIEAAIKLDKISEII